MIFVLLIPRLADTTGISSRGTKSRVGPNPARDQIASMAFLGKGGFGTVYECYLNDGTPVAVKRITVTLASQREAAKAEARLIFSLHHPHVVRLLAELEDHDAHVLVLQHGGRRTLLDVCEHGAPPLHPALRRTHMRNVCDAVRYLHTRRVAHLDIKPENVALDDHEVTRLVDFGLAVRCPDDRDEFCLSVRSGSYFYAAPEVYEKSTWPYSGYRADVWSVGVVCFGLLFRRLPFHRATRKCKEFVSFDLCQRNDGIAPFASFLATTVSPSDFSHAPALEVALFDGALVTDPRRRASMDTLCSLFQE